MNVVSQQVSITVLPASKGVLAFSPATLTPSDTTVTISVSGLFPNGQWTLYVEGQGPITQPQPLDGSGGGSLVYTLYDSPLYGYAEGGGIFFAKDSYGDVTDNVPLTVQNTATLSASPSSASPGATITFVITGLTPNAMVTLYSLSPVNEGISSAMKLDGSGGLTFTYTLSPGSPLLNELNSYGGSAQLMAQDNNLQFTNTITVTLA